MELQDRRQQLQRLINDCAISTPVLIIADVHNRIEETETLVARHAADGRTVVFLGDYFDSYGGSPMDAHFTAK